MKKISSITQLMTIAFAIVFLLAGCKKENSDTLSAAEEEQAAVYSAESETESEVVFDDVFDNVMGVNSELGTGGVGIFGRTNSITGRTSGVDSMPHCVTVTIAPIQPGVFPKTVTMDFGTGCFSHGHLRSGKIRTVYTGRLIVPGSMATTAFENFKIDSVLIEGTHKITNTSGTTTGSNQKQFTINVTDAKLTRPNGDYFSWNATRVHTQIEGNGTAGPQDDIFRVTGFSNGRVKRGNGIYLWNSKIIEPLIKKFVCRWISKGSIRTVRQGLPANTPFVALLDYGNGTCDNKATLTVNGNSRQITLH